MPIPLEGVVVPKFSASPVAREAARIARKLVGPVQGDLLDLLAALVKTNSVAIPPLGNEARAQKVLYKAVRSRKIDVETYDTDFLERSDHPYVRRDRQYSGRPNLIARMPGSGGGRSLLLNGHIDTVPPGPNRWRDDPFSAKIRGGRLYGRGSFDMKGGLAAQFGVLMALKRAGLQLRGDLFCESVIDEEWGGGGGTLAARLRGDRADACVIGEVTNLELMRATRGGQIFEITAQGGDPSRYFSKEEVVGPAFAMGRLLGWIDTWAQKRRQVGRGAAYRDFADPAPVQVLALEANRFEADVPWSVPVLGKVLVYFQFLPHEDVPAVMRAVRQSFEEFCSADPFFATNRPAWHDLVSPPLLGHELSRDHAWVQCLWDGACAVLRRDVPVTAAEFPCDAFINSNLFQIPTIVFGPRGAGAHNQNEYVNIKSVVQVAESLLAAALVWCDH